MSKICQICGKGYLKGNQVPRGIGRRVTRRTNIRQQPNLRSKKFLVDGTAITVKICASCLKRIKFESNQDSVETEPVVASNLNF
ncbi:MAG TPA: 50S ribosomal protein L28 [Patescibacteria group bacterium]|nr:50S ribosomal protein L28 [Patescibacteria group bacterium]